MDATIKAISDALSANGGWGLAALFAWVIAKLYGKMEGMRLEHNAVLRETVDMLATVQKTMDSCKKGTHGPDD